jgi:hypothetical protein
MSSRSKLSDKAVRYILENPDGLTRKELCERFGMRPGGVSTLRTRERRKAQGKNVVHNAIGKKD